MPYVGEALETKCWHTYKNMLIFFSENEQNREHV